MKITTVHIKRLAESEWTAPELVVAIQDANGESLGWYPVTCAAPVKHEGRFTNEIALDVKAPDLIKMDYFVNREFRNCSPELLREGEPGQLADVVIQVRGKQNQDVMQELVALIQKKNRRSKRHGGRKIVYDASVY